MAACVLLAAAAVTGCGKDPRERPTPEVVLTDADAGAIVSVGVGTRIVVRLESNPSTGYSWVATPPSGVLRAVGKDSTEPGETGRVGVPGTQMFAYEVVAAGLERIELRYERSWERVPVKSFSVTVQTGR
jgi:inhibitor of cysteine peptidase